MRPDVEMIECSWAASFLTGGTCGEPALTATYGADAYPLFRALAQKMRGRG